MRRWVGGEERGGEEVGGGDEEMECDKEWRGRRSKECSWNRGCRLLDYFNCLRRESTKSTAV